MYGCANERENRKRWLTHIGEKLTFNVHLQELNESMIIDDYSARIVIGNGRRITKQTGSCRLTKPEGHVKITMCIQINCK